MTRSRTARAASAFGAGVALLILGACAARSQRGCSLYQEGRYIEAAEAFEQTQYRLASSDAEQRAEYGLYRGLTYLELGDLARAREWLAYAFQIGRQSSGALDREERAELDRAWTELDARSRQQGVPPPPSAVAASAGPESPGALPNGQRSVVPAQSRSFVSQ